MHENGLFDVVDNNIVLKVDNSVHNDLCLVVDTETGTPLKWGSKTTTSIKDYYDKAVYAYTSAGFRNMADCLKFIDFTDSCLNRNEIVTFVNYVLNNIGNEKLTKLLSYTDNNLKKELIKVSAYGF